MSYTQVGQSINDPGIIFTYDPTNGNTQTKQKWVSDDITDSNRAVFDILSKGQRDAILNALDNEVVVAASGVRATPRLKWELRQYELELAGTNDTVLGQNGFWNVDGDELFDTFELKNLYSVEGLNFFQTVDDNKGTGDTKPNTGIDWFKVANDPTYADTIKDFFSTNSVVTVSPNTAILDANLDFELTDGLIESLTNLKYPQDALFDKGYAEGQDYIRINQYKYQAPNKDIIQSGGQGAVSTGLVDGLIRKSARKKQLGLVRLPMPNQIQDSNNVSWGPDQISNITAAVASGVLPMVSPDNISSLISGDFSKVIQGAQDIPANAKKLLTNIVGAMKGANAGAAAQGLLGSKILNMAGFDVSAESILARGRGVIPNNNMELLFNAPALREFQFNWKMSPRSEDEAVVVNKIIKFFKAGMAVKKQSNTGSGTGASYFLGTPNIFDVQFITTGNEQIDGIMRIKECACTACAVNYTPEGNWAAYEEGQPVSVIMTLKFSELEPIYDIDYLENKPAQYKKDNGIDDLPENAIGY